MFNPNAISKLNGRLAKDPHFTTNNVFITLAVENTYENAKGVREVQYPTLKAYVGTESQRKHFAEMQKGDFIRTVCTPTVYNGNIQFQIETARIVEKASTYQTTEVEEVDKHHVPVSQTSNNFGKLDVTEDDLPF